MAIDYAASGITAIGPDEAGLVMRFGGFVGVLEPGLHVRFPWPIERVIRLQPGIVRSLEIGFRNAIEERDGLFRWESTHGRSAEAPEPGDGDALLLTGDGQFLEITAAVQYAIDTSRPAPCDGSRWELPTRKQLWRPWQRPRCGRSWHAEHCWMCSRRGAARRRRPPRRSWLTGSMHSVLIFIYRKSCSRTCIRRWPSWMRTGTCRVRRAIAPGGPTRGSPTGPRSWPMRKLAPWRR